jgi:hypothetical protein
MKMYNWDLITGMAYTKARFNIIANFRLSNSV